MKERLPREKGEDISDDSRVVTPSYEIGVGYTTG